LSHNAIEELPSDVFKDIKNLRYLYLDYNAIKELPSNVFQDLEILEWIHIDNNQIKELHRDLFKNNLKLYVLDASNNKLQKIEVDFRKSYDLWHIDLTGNICIDRNVASYLKRDEEEINNLQAVIDENCHSDRRLPVVYDKSSFYFLFIKMIYSKIYAI
jgi:Leucine-rich repeat (LRR) protein